MIINSEVVMNFFDTVKILVIVLLLSITSIPSVGCNRAALAGKPGAEANITTGTWRLAAIQRPGAAETGIAPEPSYTIEFGMDGRVSGQAHCNRHTGQYELRQSGGIIITGGASTRMMCLGESIADEFLKTLATAARYETRDGKLILFSSDGVKLTFTKVISDH